METVSAFKGDLPEGERNGLDKASRDLTVVSSASMIAGSELGSVARRSA
jgi:hypothetical protein